MRRILALVLLFVMCFCLVSCGKTASVEPSSSQDTPVSEQPTSEPERKAFHVGETIELDTFNITLDCIDAVTGIDGYKADDGELFLLLGTTVQNTSSSVEEFSSKILKVYCDGNECTKTSLYADTYYDYKYMGSSEDIAGSKKAKLLLTAVIPEKFEALEVFFGEDSYEISFSDLGELTPDLSALGKEYKIGEEFRAIGFDITVKKVIQTDYIPYMSSFYYEPDAGKHFIVIILEAVNTSGSAVEFRYLRMDPYVDDYSTQFTTVSSSVEIDGVSMVDQYADIQPGKKVGGFIMLEVNDGWKTIELVTRESTLVIQPSDVEVE